MTTTICTPSMTWPLSAPLAVIEGYDVTFRGRHLAAFGNKTQGSSAWRPPDW